MNWLPIHADLKRGLESLKEIASDETLSNALVALARHRLSYLETIQVDSALRRYRERVRKTLPVVRIALLSSATVDHLVPGIRVAGMRHRTCVDVYRGAFGQVRQEILDEHSGLHRFEPEVVVFSISARELLARVKVGDSKHEVDATLETLCEELATLWRRARERFGALVVQQSVLDVVDPLFGGLDRFVPASPFSVVRRFDELLTDAIAREHVFLLDVARESQRQGTDTWFDRARWLQGKLEIAPAMAPLYGEMLARLIGAVRGQSKKCLVLDLDNTLWGGVIGDDGLDGIKLGEGSAVGEAHLALQRYANALKERGIILAVCSKNDPRIAESAFAEHPEMVLRRADIAAFAANWNDKAENLRAIAEQLNIGLDSLVFVDDNPVERARIREALPMVAVPELPSDPAEYVRVVASAGYFEAVSFTEEDRDRASQYAANAGRDALRGTAKSMDDFLRDLEMTSVCGPAKPVDLERVTQLLNKTNQFNTTTRRYTKEEVVRRAAEGTVLQFRLADRFGDNGLVSVLILRPMPERSRAVEVENWVMSCRVFGRQLEDAAMNVAVDTARAVGATTMEATFLPTPKNGVVADLYERLGFSCVARYEDGSSRWMIDLTKYEQRPTFIRVQVQ